MNNKKSNFVQKSAKTAANMRSFTAFRDIKLIQKSDSPDAPLVVEAYFSIYSNFDVDGDRMMPGAFRNIIKQINDGVVPMPKVFLNHISWRGDGPASIAKVLEISEDAVGAKIICEFTKGLTISDQTAAAVRHGTFDGLSFAALSNLKTQKTNERGGRDIYEILQLPEVSFVENPANKAVRILTIKSATSLRDMEQQLRALGMSAKEAKTFLAKSRALTLDQYGYEDPEADAADGLDDMEPEAAEHINPEDGDYCEGEAQDAVEKNDINRILGEILQKFS